MTSHWRPSKQSGEGWSWLRRLKASVFSCLVILASSPPPITLVLFRASPLWQGSSWYTRKDTLVCVRNRGGGSVYVCVRACVCMCVRHFLKAMHCAVSLCPAWTPKRQCICFYVCVRKREWERDSVCICAYVCVSDFPLHLPTLTEILGAFSNILRNGASQHLIKFWYASVSLL